jgi:hypothetical protein
MPIIGMVRLKQNNMKKQIGIWLDLREASIIELKAEEVSVIKMPSNIEDFNPKGGARPKNPWGSTDNMSEKKFFARKQKQKKDYYQRIIEAVQGANEIFIFGPAEAKDELLKVIKESKNFNAHLKGIERSDSMTENQKIASVKSFFNKQ